MTAPPFLFALFFASGFAGLVYELLWVRELALIFGNTAQATATTLAVFFLGLSVGQHWAGRRAGLTRDPLRMYAKLETAVALSSAAYFVIAPLHGALSAGLFGWLKPDHAISTAACAALAALALSAPCACMGATIPMMGQVVVRDSARLAPTFAVLYAVQTIGGALGAFSAAFWLPAAIGFQRTYLLAMLLSAGVAALASVASRAPRTPPTTATRAAPVPRRRAEPASSAAWFAAGIAATSGFATLSIEVLWTHMFSQALHNSIYSFAAILVTFLIALTLGGLLARRLAQTSAANPCEPLVVLLIVSGVSVAMSGFVFDWMTQGLQLYASGSGWWGYVGATFACAAVVMLGPGLVLGSVFPYSMRLVARTDDAAGAVIGRLASWNTIGGVAGSLWAGFVALPWLGLWSSIRATAFVYLLAAIASSMRVAARRTGWLLASAAGAALVSFGLDSARLPLVNLAPGEVLKSVRESAGGTVAVTERDGVLTLKLDGHYTVGASGAIANDRRQAELPMLLVPQPRSVFFLGLGTGITAGAALFHPVDRVTVAELLPDIATAAREYFGPMTAGLFTDARARLVIGDGRTVLRADPGPYDVIVGDLFVPWHAGTASLYTQEHFATVRDRLAEDGVFAQWLPLYQLSWRDFAVIARTMLSVFPQVTVWRGDFSATAPIAALIGQRTARPLDLGAVVDNVHRRQGGSNYPETRAHALALLFYGGNLSAAPELVGDAPINTDDRPVIEYLAPATPMEVLAGREAWLTGMVLSRFWAQLAAAVPPDADPFLADVTPAERADVYAGRMLYAAAVFHADGRDAEAEQAFAEFAGRVPADVAAAFGGPGRSNGG